MNCHLSCMHHVQVPCKGLCNMQACALSMLVKVPQCSAAPGAVWQGGQGISKVAGAESPAHLHELHGVDAQQREAVAVADRIRLQAHQRQHGLQQVLHSQPFMAPSVMQHLPCTPYAPCITPSTMPTAWHRCKLLCSMQLRSLRLSPSCMPLGQQGTLLHHAPV